MRYINLTFTLLLFSFVVGAQTLHNGIELPEEWPPVYPESSIPKAMEVPYLVNKPDVIDISVGRQLFVDQFLISETNLSTVNHSPVFYNDNPVFKSDKSWEHSEKGPFASPFSDGVWFDETDQLFKMLYLAGKPNTKLYYTCYAESKDGIEWEKPNLGIYGETNVVDTFTRDASSFWLDKTETDPAKRFKMFNIEHDQLHRRFHAVLKYSSDGKHWGDAVAHSGKIGDRTTFFFNPFLNKWVLSLRANSEIGRGRIRHYVEHDDPEMLVSLAHNKRTGIVDRNIKYWFSTDDKDPRSPDFPEIDPQIYNFDAIAYESLMLGYFAVWQGPDNVVTASEGIQKRNEILIGYSRDGFHWSRPSHERFFGVDMTEGAWNWANVQSILGTPIIVKDSLYFYFSGRPHNTKKLDNDIATGLAKMRRDGFVSMNSDGKEGYLISSKIKFDGEYVFVNADVNEGKLLVEVLDGGGKPIDGYTKQNCVVMQNENNTKKMITWKNHNDVSALKGKEVRLKFYLSNGELYSFWVSKWSTGESNGHTAGGGQGLSADGIDRPYNK